MHIQLQTFLLALTTERKSVKVSTAFLGSYWAEILRETGSPPTIVGVREVDILCDSGISTVGFFCFVTMLACDGQTEFPLPRLCLQWEPVSIATFHLLLLINVRYLLLCCLTSLHAVLRTIWRFVSQINHRKYFIGQSGICLCPTNSWHFVFGNNFAKF